MVNETRLQRANRSRGPTPLMQGCLLEWMQHGESCARVMFAAGNPSDYEREQFDDYIARNQKAIRAYRLLRVDPDGRAVTVDDPKALVKQLKGLHRG